MKEVLTYKYYIEERENRTLVIFPDKPFWFIGDSSIQIVLDFFSGKISEDFLQKELQNQFNYSNNETETVLLRLSRIFRDAGLFKEEESIESAKKQFKDYFPNPVINVTRRCNLKCKHCYAEAGEKWNENELSCTEIKELIDKILNNYNLAEFDKRILLSGGEPFLRKDILDIITYVYIKGGTPLINTNGLLISEGIMDTLRDVGAELLVSLDGASQESHEFLRGENTFYNTIEKIRQLKGHGVITKLSMTVHSKNINEMEEFIKIAETLEADGIALNMVNILSRAEKCGLERVKLTEFYRGLKRISKISPKAFNYISTTDFANVGAILLMNVKFEYCGVGAASLLVDYNGDIYPCYNNMNAECRLGNIRKDNILEVWNSSNKLKKLRKLNVNDFSEKCKICSVKYYCGGGCRGEAYFENKTFYSICPYCEDMKNGIIDLMFEIGKQDNEIFYNKIKYYENILEMYLER